MHAKFHSVFYRFNLVNNWPVVDMKHFQLIDTRKGNLIQYQIQSKFITISLRVQSTALIL